jgi:WS/DGAT/MGAT family acyltransferase
MVSKTHHCMIDGVTGVDISTVLMQMVPDETTIDPAVPWEPRPAPSTAALVADELTRRINVPLGIARAAVPLVRDWSSTASAVRSNLDGLQQVLKLAWRGPAHTPLNRPIGPHRRFDWTAIGLDEAKAVKKRLGGTLNDVLLAVVSGALGAFLRRRRVNVEILDFVATIPVNIRIPGDHSEGTKVAAWFARLPLDEQDPRRRLARVSATTRTLKEQAHADPTVQLFRLAEAGGPPALHAVVRLAQALNPSNLIVTNVPGPPFPLYILGSRMIAAYPLVTLLANQALAIAVFSYEGRLQFGFNADWDVVPDLHDLVLDVERAFDELRQLAAEDREQPPEPATSIATSAG